ncbi:GspE/PulE family protein [Patescibacteria group bacterium]
MVNQKLLLKIIEKNQLIPQKKLKELLSNGKNKISILDYLLTEKIITEDLLYELIANELKIPYVNLKKETIRKDILFLIPENFATSHQVVTFDKTSDEIKIATINIDNLEMLNLVQKQLGYQFKIKIYLTNSSNLKYALKQYQKSLKAEFQEITKDKKEESGDLTKLAQDLPIVRIVDTLLEYAIFENASDIHIESEEKRIIVRYRVDGVLKKVMELPKNIQMGLIARIKILSDLKLDEHRLPQDGRFKVTTDKYNVSFRVSVLPSFDGEKIVLRLLNEKNQSLTLEQLGFQQTILEIIKKNIKKPHGMMLVTGPTGSGKTTTVYTILGILNTPAVNISTVEDPIEYRMVGITQSQINPKIGFTFANGLRSILRQDPDIVMVGEIRDNETSSIAVHSAMTGHLVLSTLHTNDAITSVLRLSEMKVPSFLISSTVNIVIAQRLVRKICPNCIESYNLDKKDIESLEKQINVKNILKCLEKEKQVSSKDQSIGSILFYHGKGCKQCDNQGFKGRIGIYEVLEITKDISELIVKNAKKEEIHKLAREHGMMSILEDGFIKAKNGITTIEEVLRVTKE